MLYAASCVMASFQLGGCGSNQKERAELQQVSTFYPGMAEDSEFLPAIRYTRVLGLRAEAALS